MGFDDLRSGKKGRSILPALKPIPMPVKALRHFLEVDDEAGDLRVSMGLTDTRMVTLRVKKCYWSERHGAVYAATYYYDPWDNRKKDGPLKTLWRIEDAGA